MNSHFWLGKNTQMPKSEFKWITFSQYKFYLAFENSMCNDDITEKFFSDAEQKYYPSGDGTILA